jgi:hypothetical protein
MNAGTGTKGPMLSAHENESVMDQSPQRTVGDKTYVSLPGKVPMVRIKPAKNKDSR